jgi:hypothetical protein
MDGSSVEGCGYLPGWGIKCRVALYIQGAWKCVGYISRIIKLDRSSARRVLYGVTKVWGVGTPHREPSVPTESEGDVRNILNGNATKT